MAKTRKVRSLMQENRLAKALDGKRQPASGARTFHEGDVQTETHLIEAKTTARKSYTLTVSELEKAYAEAHANGRQPAFVVSFEKMVAPCPSDWVAIPLRDFRRLVEASNE